MTFFTERRVEFRDTDAAGIVHFSAFFPMMEVAEHEMLRSLGMSVLPFASSKAGKQTDADREDGLPPVTWPRIAASCSYTRAARFEDVLRIAVEVVRIGTTSVEYRFRFTRDEDLIAEGQMTVVCCFLRPSSDDPENPRPGGLEKTPVPESIRVLLAKHQ